MMRRLTAAWIALCFAFLPLESTAVLKGVAAAPGLQNAASVAITGGTAANVTLSGTTNAVYTLAQSGIPFIIVATGTMANNGAITVGTALATTYANAYIFLPAGAIAAGVPAAGTWYFAQFASTTVGTVFNNTYTSGAPTIPASPTAFATTGPGAYAGVTADTNSVAISLPAGAMGPNGALRLSAQVGSTSNADVKTSTFKAGATQITPNLLQNAQLNTDAIWSLRNRGNQTTQVGQANGSTVTGPGASGSGRLFTSIDFSAGQTINFTLGHATATDNVVLEGFQIEVMYAP